MSDFYTSRSRSTALIALVMMIGAIAPLVTSTRAAAQTAPATINSTPSSTQNSTQPAPATSSQNMTPATINSTPSSTQNSTQPAFSDTLGNWARPFIQALAARDIISGYPNGTFRPYQPVNRADFAVMLQKAFPSQSQVQQLPVDGFVDVPDNYWAASAIKYAYKTGFMVGYPGDLFHPNQDITKAQAIVALDRGLLLTPNSYPTKTVNQYYTDANVIPSYAIPAVAAATQAHIVVNYPLVKELAPNKTISRAEAAALIYQGLVAQGKLQPIATNTIASSYIVGGTGSNNSNTTSNSQ